MSGAEHTPVRLEEHKDVVAIKVMTQKVNFGGEDVKVDLLTYSKQHSAVFLRLVVDLEHGDNLHLVHWSRQHCVRPI